MGGGVLEGHDEAGGGAGGGGHGGGAVVCAEAGVGGGDGLFHFQSLSAALRHWICSAVHFQSG